VSLIEESAKGWEDYDAAGDFALDEDLVASVFLDSVPVAPRLLQLLGERGWTGWTRLETHTRRCNERHRCAQVCRCTWDAAVVTIQECHRQIEVWRSRRKSCDSAGLRTARGLHTPGTDPDHRCSSPPAG
jgi:hypothetical protein